MTKLAVYGHLPTLARAIQYTDDNIPEITDWLTQLLGPHGDRWEITPGYIFLDTREGDRDAPAGHWIVQDPDGVLHLIPADLFPRLYDMDGALLLDGAR